MADASRNHPRKRARLEYDDGDDETTNKYLTITIDAADFSDFLKPRGIVIFGDEPTFTPQMLHDHFTTDKPKPDDHIYNMVEPTAEFQELVVEAHNAMEQ
ncbi:hypothetical protein SLS58_002456 [Diplodia intermedia]|uniref:Uncharacterized protein n=1 Tax=Diplodia intermedia TaxID=856260 RepID=A0ABR3U0F9_9PEZI